MAKFKVNDLITDGKQTMWITGITNTDYIFTGHDGSRSTFPIDQIDKQFETHEHVRSHTQKISIEEYKGKVKIEWDAKSKEDANRLLQYVLDNFEKIVLT